MANTEQSASGVSRLERAKPAVPDSDDEIYKFVVDPPANFMCGICTKLLDDPHLTGCCGHEFCKSCLDKWRLTQKSEKKTCPHCRTENFAHMLNKRTKREIVQLRVHCSEHKHGCEWTGELGDLQKHKTVCDVVKVECVKCLQSVRRNLLAKHQAEECKCRLAKCMYCSEENSYWVIISLSHLSQCKGYPVNCPNGCGANNIQQSFMPTHKTVCPLEHVDCPFKEAGCLLRLPRKDMSAHVTASNQQHLLGMMTSLQETKVALSQTQSQMATQTQQLKDLRLFKASLEDSMKQVASKVDTLLARKPTTIGQAEVLQSIKSLAITSASFLRLNELNPVVNLEIKQVAATLCTQRPLATTTPRSAYGRAVAVKTNGKCIGKDTTSIDNSKTCDSQAFYVGDGYKMGLSVSCVSGRLAVKLVLYRGELDNDLPWPCSVNFASIHLSLVSKDQHSDRRYSLAAANDGSGAVLNSNLEKCIFTTGRVVWLHEKFAPYPLPVHYVYQNGSILFRLTWITWKTTHSTTGVEESQLRRRRSGPPATPGSRKDEDTTVPGFTFVFSRFSGKK